MKARLVTGEIEIYRRQQVGVSIFAKNKKKNAATNSRLRAQSRTAAINDDFYPSKCHPAERISFQYLSIRRGNARASIRFEMKISVTQCVQRL